MKLITQELLLKDTFPELMKGLISKYAIKDDAVFIRKGIVPDDLKFDEGERSVIAYITTNMVDRDGEIVDPAGCVMKDFMNNPVVLFGHDHKSMPIGKCAWIKADVKGLIGKTIYANTAQANEIYEYRKAGFPLAQSIGFIPLEKIRYEPDSSEAKQGIQCRYTKWLLLEYSDVPVPSNPEALTIAVNKGLLPLEKAKEFTIVLEDIEETKVTEEKKSSDIIVLEDKIPNELDTIYSELAIEERNDFIKACKDFIEIMKPGWDETDDMFRFRVKSPGLFREDTFRTVPIKKDKPRVNSVMGKLKANEGKPDDPMMMQNLMFPKADDWTLAGAKEWLSAHGDMMKDKKYRLIDTGIETWFDKDGVIYFSEEKNQDLQVIEEKSGRVISGRNRETISKAVDAMEMACTALNELLVATEPNTDNEGKKIEVDIIETTDDIDFSKIKYESCRAPNIVSANDIKKEDILTMVNNQVDAAIKQSVIPAIAEAAKSAIRMRQGKVD